MGSLNIAIENPEMSLHDVEVLFGRLMNFTQLASPMMLLIRETLWILRMLLEKHRQQASQSRGQVVHKITEDTKRDFVAMRSIVVASRARPLPILDNPSIIMADAIVIYTDASGHVIDNPSLGIYSPLQRSEEA